MIENVLEIKDTHVREVMTPLVDVVAIDTSATLVDFHTLWVTHQYSRYTSFDVLRFFFSSLSVTCNLLIIYFFVSRVPVFEQRVDNIVGIAYAMDLLDYAQKVGQFLLLFLLL